MPRGGRRREVFGNGTKGVLAFLPGSGFRSCPQKAQAASLQRLAAFCRNTFCPYYVGSFCVRAGKRRAHSP
jgi:hypothetical protein